ncbi:MAG: FtsQ-type POTRA domain-containing protein [Actinomyces sp.]|nr:MAG: FtsQ-type POTRA domain-containing protein [Actinomyces sp.]
MTAALGVDPRIRARRIAVRRAEGRRRLRILLVVCGLVAVAAGLVALARSPLFDLDRVEVAGVEGRRAELVATTAGLEPGTPLVEVDTGAAAAAVRSLPWVRRVSVERHWPGTVRLVVEPRIPVAVIPTSAGAALVDDEGVVTGFDPLAGRRTDLPRLEIDATVRAGEVVEGSGAALELIGAVPDDLAAWLDAVVVGDEGLSLRLVGGVEVLVGDLAEPGDVVTSLRAVLAGVDRECLALIDVRVPDLVTVRRRPDCLDAGGGGGA